METLTLGGLFEGIGGFPLAARLAGIQPLWSNDIEPYCCAVLRKNFKHTIYEKDIRNIETEELDTVDIISGGFPCQPFSVAGKRGGASDDRYLWPQMLRIITAKSPKYVLCENVLGIINMELDTVLSDLEAIGYETEAFIIPAVAKNAWHRRDRVWVIAYANGQRCDNGAQANRQPYSNGQRNLAAQNGQGHEQHRVGQPNAIANTNGSWQQQPEGAGYEIGQRNYHGTQAIANANGLRWENGLHGTQPGWQAAEFGNSCAEPIPNGSGQRCEEQRRAGHVPTEWNAIKRCDWWGVEPTLDRMVYGLPNRVDRIKSLGNAIVPQIAYEIFKAIIEHHKLTSNAAKVI